MSQFFLIRHRLQYHRWEFDMPKIEWKVTEIMSAVTFKNKKYKT